MHGSDAARASRDANVPEIERPRPDRASPHHDHGEIFSASLTATIYTMISVIVRGNVSARHCLAAQHQPCANRRQRCTARGAVFQHSPAGLEAPPTQCHEPGAGSTASRPWPQLIVSRLRCSTWCRDGTAGGHRHRRPAVLRHTDAPPRAQPQPVRSDTSIRGLGAGGEHTRARPAPPPLHGVWSVHRMHRRQAGCPAGPAGCWGHAGDRAPVGLCRRGKGAPATTAQEPPGYARYSRLERKRKTARRAGPKDRLYQVPLCPFHPSIVQSTVPRPELQRRPGTSGVSRRHTPVRSSVSHHGTTVQISGEAPGQRQIHPYG